MPVSAFGHWLWNDDPSSVDCLPAVLEINSSGDFLDEHWGQSLGSIQEVGGDEESHCSPDLLVDTEEIDLHHWDGTVMHRDVCRDGSDEADELVIGCGAHAHMPLLKVSRGLEGPLEELFGVIKSERGEGTTAGRGRQVGREKVGGR